MLGSAAIYFFPPEAIRSVTHHVPIPRQRPAHSFWSMASNGFAGDRQARAAAAVALGGVREQG